MPRFAIGTKPAVGKVALMFDAWWIDSVASPAIVGFLVRRD
jgi:hypothetical protein